MGLSASPPLVVFAIAAHPDDIEFGMAGTLLEFKQRGAEIHMWNLANGGCGTQNLSRAEIVRLRQREAAASAQLAGAVLHPPLVNDLEIYYEKNLLAQVAALIRQVRPAVILVPSLQDYMEDHVNTARLAVTGAFAHGMRNFETHPPMEPWEGDIAIYHAMPHGGLDPYGRFILPERFVDISHVITQKIEMLSQHESQKSWLQDSQGMDSTLNAMLDFSQRLGKISGKFTHAEGWQQHNPLGLAGSVAFDPMKVFLTDIIFDQPARTYASR